MDLKNISSQEFLKLPKEEQDKILNTLKECNHKYNELSYKQTIEENKKKKELVYPAIYRHFKHSDENVLPNNYIYVTIGISKPLSLKNFPSDIYKRDKYSPMSIHHTEFDDENAIYNIYNQWYHSKEWCSRELVLYKSLYDNNITYARPIDMFLSEVDKEKYPNINQEYRFELVRY